MHNLLHINPLIIEICNNYFDNNKLLHTANILYISKFYYILHIILILYKKDLLKV